MSGLSSLRGAPIPVRRSADASNSGDDSKAEGLSSLSNAPPLGVRSSMSAAPTASGGGGLGAGRTAGVRDAAVRRSTPVFSGSRAQDDDEDSLFPKSRGLVKKEFKKGPSISNDSDSDDGGAGAVFPTGVAGKRSGAAPGSSGAGTSPSPFGAGSSTSASTAAKAKNPIMAMLEDNDDDDFLAGLAPPKKEATKPEPAAAAASTASSSSSNLARSASARAAGARSAGAAVIAPASGVGSTNKSIDTLMSFLKADDDILTKPLPAVDEEPLDLFGGSSKASTTPKRGRRAGGDEPSLSLSQPEPSLSAPSMGQQTSGRGGTSQASGGGSQMGDGSDEMLPGLGSGSQSKQASNIHLETGPSLTSLPTPTATQAAQQFPPPAPAPAPAYAPKDYSLELSDGDLPGMGSPAIPASLGRGSGVPTPASTTSTLGSARGGLPPKGPSSGGSLPPPAAGPSKPVIGDSWEMDADALLPDESQSSITARGGGAGGGAAAAAAAAVAASAAPAVGAAIKQPSRLQHSSSARATSPARGASGGDEEDEEPSGYMPSFAAAARRSAPNPFNQPAATDGVQRQRRSLVPDAAASQPNISTATKAKTRDQEEREKTAAATATAISRREQSAAAAKPAPVSAAPFRLPSEVRASDTLSVSINSPASATPKPAGLAMTAAAGPVAGRRAAAGPVGRSAADLGILDSSTDDDSFPALQKASSPALQAISGPNQSQKAQAMQQQSGSSILGKVDNKMAASAPSPLHLPQQQQQQQSVQQHGLPPGVQRMQPAGSLPPGVQLGTAHGTAAAAPQLQPHARLPPGVTPLGASAVPAGLTPIPTSLPPHGMTPVATAPFPGVMQYAAIPQQAPGITLMPQPVHSVVSASSAVDVERMAQLQSDHDKSREDVSKLRKQVADLEATVRERDSKIREVENRAAAADANSKISLAETQVLAVKESSALRGELEDMRSSLSRVKAQYQQMDEERQKEMSRLRAELEATRTSHMEEVMRIKEDAAQLVVVAEARGRRAGLIEKEVAEAQLKAQQAALAEEKEVVHRHRLSADLLAQLSDKVRAAATATFEREDRALRSLERDVQDREARIASREKVLSEREARVLSRERELDSLRGDLQSLTTTLEGSAAHEREDLRREQSRLAREAARMDALQGSLLSEREDLRVQVQIEHKLLEEAREARRKERDTFVNEMLSERRTLAVEQADLMRQLDASRAELLQLKQRVIEYESRAGAALQQALAEEDKLAKAKEAGASERVYLAAAHQSLQDEKELLESEAAKLVEYAAKLQAQSTELAMSNSELDDLKVELVRQRQELAMELAQVKAQALQLDEQRRQLDVTKKAFDRERLSIAEERRVLSDERMAASKAADAARDAQMKLAEAVRQWVAQGVPIPFSVQTTAGTGGPMSVQPNIPGMTSKGAAFSPMPSASPDKRSAGNSKRERAASAAIPARRSKNTLRHMLDKMGLDLGEMMGQGGRAGAANRSAGAGAYDLSDYVRQQKEFLTQLRMSAPDMHASAAGTAPPVEAAYFTTDVTAVDKLRYAGESSMAGFPGFSAMKAAAAARGVPTPRAYDTMAAEAMQEQAAGVPGISALPRPMGLGLRGAVAAGQPNVDPRSLDMIMSDILDQNTLASSEFTSMVPMSATTSEHDGGGYSQPGQRRTDGAAPFGADGSGAVQGGLTSSSSGTQGSHTPARHGAGVLTGHLTSDLSDTALSPLALHSPSTTSSKSSGASASKVQS